MPMTTPTMPGPAAFSMACAGDPRSVFRRAQGEILGLCDILEDIADSLPDNLDRRKCRLAATSIEPLIIDVHRFEEHTIFPMARRELSRLGAPNRCIRRLEAEHFEDQCYAGELSAALTDAIEGASFHAEMLGYMLRGFFDSVRRHTAFERDYLLILIDPG